MLATLRVCWDAADVTEWSSELVRAISQMELGHRSQQSPKEMVNTLHHAVSHVLGESSRQGPIGSGPPKGPNSITSQSIRSQFAYSEFTRSSPGMRQQQSYSAEMEGDHLRGCAGGSLDKGDRVAIRQTTATKAVNAKSLSGLLWMCT